MAEPIGLKFKQSVQHKANLCLSRVPRLSVQSERSMSTSLAEHEQQQENSNKSSHKIVVFASLLAFEILERRYVKSGGGKGVVVYGEGGGSLSQHKHTQTNKT